VREGGKKVVKRFGEAGWCSEICRPKRGERELAGIRRSYKIDYKGLTQKVIIREVH
jgi:hypothetical protein